jgi:hypothetical protein
MQFYKNLMPCCCQCCLLLLLLAAAAAAASAVQDDAAVSKTLAYRCTAVNKASETNEAEVAGRCNLL